MTALYALDKVPSKSVPKTTREIWTERKPSPNLFSCWGLSAEVNI